MIPSTLMLPSLGTLNRYSSTCTILGVNSLTIYHHLFPVGRGIRLRRTTCPYKLKVNDYPCMPPVGSLYHFNAVISNGFKRRQDDMATGTEFFAVGRRPKFTCGESLYLESFEE